MENKLINQLELQYSNKKQTVLQILQLTIKQSYSIKGQSIDELIKLLEKRKNLMDDVDRIDQKIILIQKQISSCLGTDSSFNSINLLKQEISVILKNIITEDNANKSFLNNLLKDVEQKIIEIKRGKVLQRAYNSNGMQSYGYFIDNKK